jgi:hypothetical protein
MKYIEYTKQHSPYLAVASTADVIVAGGGPAGVCAAIAAARNGAKTVLLEQSGCLGGTWTSGCLGWIIDWMGKNGLLYEIIDELKQMNFLPSFQHESALMPFAPEGMKLVLEKLCQQANVQIRLYTMVSDVIKNDNGPIEAIVTESKSGREAWRGSIFIDATGDGDLGARSGCSYQMGNSRGKTQPMSLIALLTGINASEAAPYIRNYSPREQAVGLLLNEFLAADVSPSYKDPTLFHVGGDIFFLMSNHQYNSLGINADDLTQATINARQEINQQFEALRRRGGIWKNIQIITTAPHIGVREGRRLKGIYEVTIDDLKKGTRHADAVCRPAFCIDVHALEPDSAAIEPPPLEVKPYDIPLRALISADVDNLLMAGRCISGDFYAHASYRVTGNAAVLGEAAGVCAAIAAKNGLFPKQISNEMFFEKYEPLTDQYEGIAL